MDKYIAELGSIASTMEAVYGYGMNGINNIIDAAIKNAESITAENKKKMSHEIGRAALLLSYAANRLNFYGKQKIDFSSVPCIVEVARVLLLFTKRQKVTTEALEELDRCIVALAVMEEGNQELKMQMSYRFLMLFIVSVCYGFLCNASVLAKFLLDQIVMGVDYDN